MDLQVQLLNGDIRSPSHPSFLAPCPACWSPLGMFSLHTEASRSSWLASHRELTNIQAIIASCFSYTPHSFLPHEHPVRAHPRPHRFLSFSPPSQSPAVSLSLNYLNGFPPGHPASAPAFHPSPQTVLNTEARNLFLKRVRPCHS